MKQTSTQLGTRGLTLVEVLIAAAVFSLVFGGLFLGIRYSTQLIDVSRGKAGALALANERIEYIRSLSYNSVGTIGGIPNGPIPQHASTTLNDLVYHERVVIQNVDSPDDGEGAADTNGILADFKRVKVEYTWENVNGTSSISLITNIVPPGIESTAGGGTLRVNVFDADVQPVSGAEVRVYNDTTTSTIDTTVNTNISGQAIFAGAPAAANYEITVTGTGLSTDQTYSATTSNPNPSTPHVAVIESLVSTMNFQIDELSDLDVLTVGPSTDGSFTDSFDDSSLIHSTSSTETASSTLVLTGGPGSYAPAGTALAASTTPGGITSWDVIDFLASIPASTTLVVQLYSVSGSTYTLVPDGDLPGNSTGFSSGPIDISGVPAGTYPTLALGAALSSSDSAVTPSLDSWGLHYIITEPSIPNVPLTLTGNKTIGTTASASPVYKYSEAHTTDGGGTLNITDLEWDVYDVTLGTGAYTVEEACSDIPYALNPGVSDTLKLTLVSSVPYSLRVRVVDIDGDPIIGANVDLTRTAFSDSGVTSSCGQVFFGTGLTSAADYQVDVSASGYTSESVTDVEIDGNESLVVTLSV